MYDCGCTYCSLLPPYKGNDGKPWNYLNYLHSCYHYYVVYLVKKFNKPKYFFFILRGITYFVHIINPHAVQLMIDGASKTNIRMSKFCILNLCHKSTTKIKNNEIFISSLHQSLHIVLKSSSNHIIFLIEVDECEMFMNWTKSKIFA